MATCVAVACGGGHPTALEVRDAFAAAGAGDDGRCVALVEADLRGFCEFSAAVAGASDPSRCRRISDLEWRDECAFELADRLLVSGDPEVALRLCTDAGGFRLDCARHVGVQAWRRGGGLSEGFVEAFGGIAPELGDPRVWIAETRYQVYVDAARHAPSFTVAGCAGGGGWMTMARRTCSVCCPSFAAATVTVAPKGMPRSSVAKCTAVPHLARSTGLGPLASPLFELCAWTRR